MWKFGRRIEPEPVKTSPTLLDHEERLLQLELKLRAFDVEMEDFVAQVGKAARRAYKREADQVKADSSTPAPSGHSEAHRRLTLKRALRNRAQGGS